MSATTTTSTPRRVRYGYAADPAQGAALVTGVVFLLLGVLGFVPGVTTDLGGIKGAGPDSTAMLFGIFQISVLMNIINLVIGFIGVASAKFITPSTLYLLGFGSIYLVLWVYGAASGNIENGWNFLPTNDADQALRSGLGFAMLITAAATSTLALKGSRFDPQA